MHEQIVSIYPEYQAETNERALAACIDWGKSTLEKIDVQLVRAVTESTHTDAPIPGSHLMREAMSYCNGARAQYKLDCKCFPADRSGKSALKIPDSFLERTGN
jgi:hypothetical protein